MSKIQSNNYMPIFQFLVLLLVSVQGSTPEVRKILSFGGNGMIGSETLHSLFKSSTEQVQYDVTLVSRGSWPYDSSETIKPNVETLFCDRGEGLLDDEDCLNVVEEINETDEYYAVLDFSCFDRERIEDTFKVLTDANNTKVRVYIYISTDNVYEVSQPFENKYNKDGSIRKLKEEDAVRPLNETLRNELNEKDSYGNDKLAVEEFLVEQSQKENAIPFVSIRLGDVIGRNDSSDRFSVYYLWIKFLEKEGVPGIHVPEDILETHSITYLSDAAQGIISAMETPASWNNSYNIACFETFNTTRFIEDLASLMGRKDIQIKRLPEAESFSTYPGVTRAPLDISKAVKKLKFEPTPVIQAINETLLWFDESFQSSSELRDRFLQEWTLHVFEDEDEYPEEFVDDLVNSITKDYDDDESEEEEEEEEGEEEEEEAEEEEDNDDDDSDDKDEL